VKGNDMDALVVEKVRKTFEAENAPVRALRGADLVVPSGDFVALMGPSGCGKSTLLNLVAGLDVADEGTITVAGELVTGRSEDELSQLRRKHIGIVFQFFNLLEGMTVLENVALPAVIAGRKRRMAETRARDLLDLLGIGDKASTVPGMLSGGQRQRLAIARALVRHPAMLLLDEATSHLDAVTETALHRNLSALDCTQILIGHRLSTVRNADLIMVLHDGQIAETGTHAGLLSRGGRYASLVAAQLDGHSDTVRANGTPVALAAATRTDPDPDDTPERR
jgi:putative ABC transport system ATP-binding protein